MSNLGVNSLPVLGKYVNNPAKFLEDVPQNTMLVATSISVYGIAYAIFQAAFYLSLGYTILGLTSLFAYRELSNAATMKENLDLMEKHNAHHEKLLTQQKTQIQELEDTRVKLESGMTTTLGSHRDELKKEVADLRGHIEELKKQGAAAATEARLQQERLSALLEKLEKVETEIKARTDQLNAANATHEVLVGQLAGHARRLSASLPGSPFALKSTTPGGEHSEEIV